MATALSFDDIVANAGKLVGNETLTTFAGVWLNNIIDTLAQNHKFPELEKTVTGVLAAFGGTAISVDFPSDFGDLWDHNSLGTIDANGNHWVMVPQTWDWYDLLTQPNSTGRPTNAAFNLRDAQWTPYPQPPIEYTWQMRYYIKPSRVVTGTDTIPFANDEIFIQALFVRLLQYEDDERYPAEYAMLNQMVSKYFGGLNTSAIRAPAVRFNSAKFKTPYSFR